MTPKQQILRLAQEMEEMSQTPDLLLAAYSRYWSRQLLVIAQEMKDV